MATYYFDTGGATTNSGTTDQNSANLSGTAATAAGTVVTLDGSPDLSGLVTSGASQSAIYLNQATNSNRKIFPITAFDNGAKTVTVSVAPTGITSSSWAIGGRNSTLSTLVDIAQPGDVVTLNTDSSGAGVRCTFRTAGNSTSGYVKLKGKSGIRPVVRTTDTSNCISLNSLAQIWIENIEVQQQGATGAAFTANSGAGCVLNNVRVTDSGAGLTTAWGMGSKIIGSELTGIGGTALTIGSGVVLDSNYIHDNLGDGLNVNATGASSSVHDNIIERNTGNGVNVSGAPTAVSHVLDIAGNTIYRNDQNGIVIADAEWNLLLINNVLKDNGDAGTEYNLNWSAGTAENVSIVSNNCFSIAGGRGGGNYTGVTPDASNITTDPAFVAPDASAGSRNFGLGSSSPCKATGTPGTFLNSSTVSYTDMGAAQRQEPSGSGGRGGYSQVIYGLQIIN